MQLTREPGGSPGAEIIRHVLLSGAAKPLGPDVEAMLFAAARDDHVQCTILPALESGKWVICDRFVNSTRVYQGILGQVDHRLIRRLERVAIGDLMPDLTLMLDIPVEVGMARARKRRGSGGAGSLRGGECRIPPKAARSLSGDRGRRAGALRRHRRQRRQGSRGAGDLERSSARKLDPVTSPLAGAVRRHRSRRLSMSPRATSDDDETDEAPHPRATTDLFGHAAAEAALLAAYRSGRVPHAFLIAGPKGIGKATLAYRMARFVLAHPDPAVARRASGGFACGRRRKSGRAAHRRAGAARSSDPRTHAQRQRRAA